jgi:hypothetical protein
VRDFARSDAYLLVLDAEALVLLLQELDLPLQLADIGLLARAGARGGLAVLDHALLAAVGAPDGAGGAEAHLVLQRAAGAAGVEAVGEEGRRRGRGRVAEAATEALVLVADAAIRGEDAGVVGRGAAVRGGRGEEVEAGAEAELRGDEGGGGGLRRGRAGAGGVGPYVLIVVHVHGRHRVGARSVGASLSCCLFWARSGAPPGHRVRWMAAFSSPSPPGAEPQSSAHTAVPRCLCLSLCERGHC